MKDFQRWVFPNRREMLLAMYGDEKSSTYLHLFGFGKLVLDCEKFWKLANGGR